MISFVIPAHNEEAYLPATLEAVHVAAKATGEAYEIIVVDDDSSDRTGAIAAEAGARVQRVAVRQISRARNAGAAAARGRWLFFLDADTCPTVAVVRAALAAMQAEAVGGGARVVFDQSLTPMLQSTIWMWNTISRLTRWAAGCFVFVRREAFDAVGGFSEDLFAAEEIEISMKLKRLGPFGILRDEVVTSARKLESYSVGTFLGLMVKTILTRGRLLEGREGLDVWYAAGRGER